MPAYAPGSLVRARDREWVVQADSTDDFLVLRPLGGDSDDDTGLLPAIEPVAAATFPPPTVADLGDHASARLLREALRIGFRSSAGPFRSLASLAVEPRAYQLVPLLLALRQPTTRLLIADDVGIGKTVEAGLIAAELLATGQARGLTVLCSPALAEQWQAELRTKFGLDAALVLPSTATKLQRGLGMDESIFTRHPVTVVSTDFIKSPVRRDEFIRAAPDLLIVDEAHTSVSDGAGAGAGGSGRTQRHELLRRLGHDPGRHLLLVTATPHSGREEGFRNLLALLHPDLAEVDLDSAEGRARLARHFVQRRRGDIRRYLDQDTPFPSDRLSKELPYTLHGDYRSLFDDVLAYARETVRGGDGGVQQRVRWWSALALLRSLASSPAAAAATLRTRAASAAAATVDEADELGRVAVLDLVDEEGTEGIDVAPGAAAAADDDGQAEQTEQRRLTGFAQRADALAGPTRDRKLAAVTDSVKQQLADGYDPIVFCRFIPTAEYVGAHLASSLGAGTRVEVVTGTLPPAERVARIEDMAESGQRLVLVATDCLSEGVNLQQSFQAVIHYDLAWNPTRHEQREGRVDRFGQAKDTVRAVTMYGTDNTIDGLVLEILLRKHEAIRKATGVSVPVPDSSNQVVEAVLEGLLLRGPGHQADQLELDGIADTARQALAAEWESQANQEKASRTKYAQEGIKPAEVAREIEEVRQGLGSNRDVDSFLRATLRALGSQVSDTAVGITATTAALPQGLTAGLVPGHAEPLPFHRDPPAPRREAVIARTDPNVAAIAGYVLEAALDPHGVPTGLADRLAKRSGVFTSSRVQRATTVLLVRIRMRLTLPGRAGDPPREQVVEQAATVGYRGNPDEPDWLSDAEVAGLVADPASSIGAGKLAQDALGRALAHLDGLSTHLDDLAGQTAQRLLESHRRVRQASGDRLRGLAVEPILPVDVLGLWVYRPGGAA